MGRSASCPSSADGLHPAFHLAVSTILWSQTHYTRGTQPADSKRTLSRDVSKDIRVEQKRVPRVLQSPIRHIPTEIFHMADSVVGGYLKVLYLSNLINRSTELPPESW